MAVATPRSESVEAFGGLLLAAQEGQEEEAGDRGIQRTLNAFAAGLEEEPRQAELHRRWMVPAHLQGRSRSFYRDWWVTRKTLEDLETRSHR